MRSLPTAAAVVASAGAVVVAEVAHRAGSIPVGRPTDDLQVVIGAALVAAGAGAAIILGALGVRRPVRALIAVAALASLVLLGMPYLERAIVGIDPGFLVRSFTAFEWSPAARFVLFPAVREAAALIALTTTLAAVLRRTRPVPEPLRS